MLAVQQSFQTLLELYVKNLGGFIRSSFSIPPLFYPRWHGQYFLLFYFKDMTHRITFHMNWGRELFSVSKLSYDWWSAHAVELHELKWWAKITNINQFIHVDSVWSLWKSQCVSDKSFTNFSDRLCTAHICRYPNIFSCLRTKRWPVNQYDLNLVFFAINHPPVCWNSFTYKRIAIGDKTCRISELWSCPPAGRK